ncbi:hypothetical protein F3Y22_tig00111954pilonHSYRG00004 [Hibiscus syriacus]|uniref:cyclin-dependent kinase n=1 Tax=Hibiscus syriacus TaxID=106335 RepID=A0A6A2X8P0_HIBSY|nr:hypothetical protein F3Y22_tig00111954pilonHSYRG00004 [Hibiscus syriacus]
MHEALKKNPSFEYLIHFVNDDVCLRSSYSLECSESRKRTNLTESLGKGRYEILELVGSGASSDVYRARRLSDDLIVSLKEVHDYQSAFREIVALQVLRNCPNIVGLHDYFLREDEDAVLVLEFLRTDLAAVIRDAEKKGGGVRFGEVKVDAMLQVLCGLDACHRNMIVHRDLKPGNL